MKSWLQDNIWKFTQQTIKENLMLLKSLLELWRIISTNLWFQYQKEVYVNKSNHIIDKYNNKYHKTIIMLRQIRILTFMLKLMKKIPKFKVGNKYKNHVSISKNIRVFLQNVTLQIGLKKLL